MTTPPHSDLIHSHAVIMARHSLEKRSQLLLDHEAAQASNLARMVLDKPKPPVWMILVPVFFVFYAYKLQEYKKGLASFAEHVQVSPRRALQAATTAVQQDAEPDLEPMLAMADGVPPEILPLYRTWVSLLSDHFRNLLLSQENSVGAMIRTHYGNKACYLRFIHQLGKAEDAFNRALVPTIEGERDDILYVTTRMRQCQDRLRQQLAEELFPQEPQTTSGPGSV